jgi:hypothetical protein
MIHFPLRLALTFPVMEMEKREKAGCRLGVFEAGAGYMQVGKQ